MAKSKATITYIGEQSHFVLVHESGVYDLGRFPPDSIEVVVEVDDRRYVPANYVEFASIYGPFIKRIVSNFNGIDRQDVDDFTQEIMYQFISGDYLSIYSPEKQQAFAVARYRREMEKWTNGKGFRPDRYEGKFSSYVFEFTKVRLMGWRDKSNRKKMLNSSLDTFFEGEDSESQPDSLLYRFGFPDEEFQNIELRELLKRAYSYLAEVSESTTTRNFMDLFVAATLEPFQNQEGFDREKYGKSKGICVSAVSMQMRTMRKMLENIGLFKDLVELNNRRCQK